MVTIRQVSPETRTASLAFTSLPEEAPGGESGAAREAMIAGCTEAQLKPIIRKVVREILIEAAGILERGNGAAVGQGDAVTGGRLPNDTRRAVRPSRCLCGLLTRWSQIP